MRIKQIILIIFILQSYLLSQTYFCSLNENSEGVRLEKPELKTFKKINSKVYLRSSVTFDKQSVEKFFVHHEDEDFLILIDEVNILNDSIFVIIFDKKKKIYLENFISIVREMNSKPFYGTFIVVDD
tara:strand:- start:5450 stop:5830 length:381 start_codon:yes stop_codon:yes gene_type:complete